MSDDYKQTFLSVTFRMIKEEDKDHVCVCVCGFRHMFTCVWGGAAQLHRCTQTQFLWDGFNMWQDQQKTRWHDHFIADPQTNHLFKRHFKRLPRKATRWGLEKSCAFFYFPSVIIQLDLRSLLWCMKCCARIYKIQRRDRCLSLRREKWELSLSVCLYDRITWSLYPPHQSRSV